MVSDVERSSYLLNHMSSSNYSFIYSGTMSWTVMHDILMHKEALTALALYTICPVAGKNRELRYLNAVIAHKMQQY